MVHPMQIPTDCAVFLDAGYIEYVIRQDFPGIQIDYVKLVSEISKEHILFRSFYYNCLPYLDVHSSDSEKSLYEGKINFFEALKFLPRFEVRLGELSRFEDHDTGAFSFHQKRVDSLITVDMLEVALRHQVKTIILATGDSDLIPAVKAIKRAGLICILWHSSLKGKAPPSRELFQICDERFEFESIIDKIQKQNYRS